MTSAKMENGDLFTCRYDAEGLRHETEENGHLIKYIYRNRDVAVEENEEDGTTRYIRGNGRLIASDSEKARTYYHYVSDNIGSINYVINNATGQSSTISDRIECSYEYDAFGNVIECKEKIRNIFKFAGEQYDLLTNQYYLKARYYNPVIGRFIQMDTYHGDGLNLYTYVGNNPVRYVDPSGHDKIIASCKDGSVSEGGSNYRYTKTGYISGERSNNLLGRDRSTKRTINLTEWRRSISKQDIGNERRLFLGDDYVKVSEGKWRSLDGTRQFRVKPDDYAGSHGIGMPIVPNTPHVHFEFLTPRSNGKGFDVIQNVHVPLID